MSKKQQKFILKIDATGSTEVSDSETNNETDSKMQLTIESDCTRGFMMAALAQVFSRDADILIAAKLALISVDNDGVIEGEVVDLTLNK